MNYRWLLALCLFSTSVLAHEHGQTTTINLKIEHYAQMVEYNYTLRVSGDIMIGTNDCNADGYQAAFLVTHKGNKIYVLPTKVGENTMICGPEFEPVFQNISIIVEGNVFDADDVIVQNVDRIGRSVSALRHE